MGFADVMKSKFMTSSGGLLGAAGGILGSSAALFGNDGRRSQTDRGIVQNAAGIAELISGFQGVMTGGVNLFEKDKTPENQRGDDDEAKKRYRQGISLKRWGGGLNGLSSLMTMGAGITDLLGGHYTIKAASNGAEAESYKRKSANTGIAGGVFNTAGSLLGIGGGIADAIAGFRSKDKAAGFSGALNAVGNLVTMGGGIAGIISGAYTRKGLGGENNNAYNVTAGRATKASGWLGMIGSLIKTAGSIGGYFQKSQNTPQIAPAPDAEQGPEAEPVPIGLAQLGAPEPEAGQLLAVPAPTADSAAAPIPGTESESAAETMPEIAPEPEAN